MPFCRSCYPSHFPAHSQPEEFVVSSDTGSETSTASASLAEREWDSLFFPDFACCVLPKASSSEREAASKRGEPLTASFRLEVDHMPPPERPKADVKHLIVDDMQIPDLTLEQIETGLETDAVVLGYLEQFSHATDISLSAWCDAPGGIRVRRAQFTMPVPQEVPPALARLISIPQASRATMLLGIVAAAADELLVLLQQCMHDVPYGENFRVHETMSFRPRAGGGVTFSKWTLVKWVKSLPFMMAPMRPITESKTAAGSHGGAEAFIRGLREAAASAGQSDDSET